MKLRRQIVMGFLLLGFAWAGGCKSGARNGAGEYGASPAKRKNSPATGDSVVNPGGGVPPPVDSSNSSNRSVNKVSGRESVDADQEVDKKETYEGGDPDIYRAPRHTATPTEKIEHRAQASTPTPTPNRPIDRPLDPAGLPLSSSTPGG